MDLFSTKSGHQFWAGNTIALVALFVLIFALAPIANGALGDFDDDSDVDYLDLANLASNWLNSPCGDPDWCGVADLDLNQRVDFNDFVILAANWGPSNSPPPSAPDNFTIFNKNTYPTRLAIGPNADLYVTDAKSGSVFIYDLNFTVTGELRRLGEPLGLAVDALGNIYVGSNKRKVVEVYNTKGFKTNTIGLGLIEMPSDIAFDNDGKIYVVDSRKNTVWVFNTNGAVIRSIGKSGSGDGQFDFPIALEIAYRGDPNSPIPELFVADRGNYKVQVFDLDGNFKRSFGEPVYQSMMGGWKWKGRFNKLQGLAMDSDGNLHVLDCYMNMVQILNPDTGAYIDNYGNSGSEDDKLKLPFDVILDAFGDSIVTDTGNKRIEAFILNP